MKKISGILLCMHLISFGMEDSLLNELAEYALQLCQEEENQAYVRAHLYPCLAQAHKGPGKVLAWKYCKQLTKLPLTPEFSFMKTYRYAIDYAQREPDTCNAIKELYTLILSKAFELRTDSLAEPLATGSELQQAYELIYKNNHTLQEKLRPVIEKINKS